MWTEWLILWLVDETATLKLKEESIIYHMSYNSKVVCDLKKD